MGNRSSRVFCAPETYIYGGRYLSESAFPHENDETQALCRIITTVVPLDTLRVLNVSKIDDYICSQLVPILESCFALEELHFKIFQWDDEKKVQDTIVILGMRNLKKVCISYSSRVPSEFLDFLRELFIVVENTESCCSCPP